MRCLVLALVDETVDKGRGGDLGEETMSRVVGAEADGVGGGKVGVWMWVRAVRLGTEMRGASKWLEEVCGLWRRKRRAGRDGGNFFSEGEAQVCVCMA